MLIVFKFITKSFKTFTEHNSNSKRKRVPSFSHYLLVEINATYLPSI